MTISYYSIGNHCIEVTGENICSSMQQMDNFKPFRCEKHPAMVEVYRFEAASRELHAEIRQQIYHLDEEGVDIRFGRSKNSYTLQLTWNGELHLTLSSEQGSRLCLLEGDMHPRLLSFAIWMGYGIMTAHAHTLLIHSSCIVNQNKAVLFLGESGTGKSTHTRLWQTHIVASHLLNDDCPIIRMEDGKVWAYGGPWSGKMPCYRNERYELKACVRLSQAPFNKMTRLSKLQAYASLHPSCPPAFAYDEYLYDGICETLGYMLENAGCYSMACLPNAEAAKLSHAYIFNTPAP